MKLTTGSHLGKLGLDEKGVALVRAGKIKGDFNVYRHVKPEKE
jgi:hypothetical protein